MSRLNREESRARNRGKVLAAARAEFAERGFRDVKVDRIAERAGLTRGAVYSNFPGKRALYFSVLADEAETEPAATTGAGDTPESALAAFARAWVARFPLATDAASVPGGLTGGGNELAAEISVDERLRLPFAQLLRLDAILLGLALESLRGTDGENARMVRVAETALSLLHGASRLAFAAPEFVEPFNAVSACARLATLDLGDWWLQPDFLVQARPVDESWDPPRGFDAVRVEFVPLQENGVLAVLGSHRLAAIEQAVRSAPPGTPVTLVVVSGDPGESAPLARLVLAEFASCLRQGFPLSSRLPRVVHDPTGAVAAAAGVRSVGDETEVAVRIEGGRIVARAEGFGACHAAAVSGVDGPRDRAPGEISRGN